MLLGIFDKWFWKSGIGRQAGNVHSARLSWKVRGKEKEVVRALGFSVKLNILKLQYISFAQSFDTKIYDFSIE